MSEAPLAYNPKNAVTQSIERVEVGGKRCVRKVLNGNNRSDTPPEWRASNDPQHWNYWRREHEVYTSDIAERLRDTGVRLPKLYDQRILSEYELELILEDVDGRSGHELTIADCATICAAWGCAQPRLDGLLQTPWSSREFVAAYAVAKPADYTLLDSDHAWQRPLIADNWPMELRDGLTYLHAHVDSLLDVLRAAPRLACHLDFWPNNVVLTEANEVVLIDWAFFGAGSMGEDVGNFIPDAIFDGFFPAEQFSELESTLFGAYLEGFLASSEHPVDEQDAHKWLWASAIKYVWLGPLLLARAASDQQSAYGGRPLADANQQYRDRGITLLRLCEWAERALEK